MASVKQKAQAKQQKTKTAKKTAVIKEASSKKAKTTAGKSPVTHIARAGSPSKKTVQKKKPAKKIIAAPKSAPVGLSKTTTAVSGENTKSPKSVQKLTEPSIKKRAADMPAAERFRGLKGMLITKRDSILKESKLEIAKYISGENRQLVDTAIDEADWAAVDISEDISLKRLAAHKQLLVDIEECLRKIKEGTYGICEDCGEEISEKRLHVIPTATLCIDCKELRERMAAFEQDSEV